MARFYGVPKPGAVGVLRSGRAGGYAVTSRVRVVGVPEALIKLGLVNKVARIHLGALSHHAAAAIERRAKENIHNVTGNLESGTKMEPVGPYTWIVTSSSMAGDVAEKNNVEYAGFVEFGTSNMPAGTYPSCAYMRKAYNDTMPEAIAQLKWIGKELERL